ncbi:retinol dehydrogenase 12-like [Rhagoletis pomonella]|uniref:retinol dehydrogenase 12-like n=1 Tax=Rhagoletis pomonella TaxID=28610 RepID=UPI00177D7C08|nr:retinol dehydrogenase 12-like [Rhagoletis pomonella]XP_036343909.1 retinol dehydrogenase 12-like [Rhagoletis pomonella]
MPDSEEEKLCFHGVWVWLLPAIFIAVAVLFFLWLLRKCIQGPRYRKANRIDGKVVIVTGCNTGIGKATALELARRGGRIYMACRDAVRCEAARLEIVERTGNQHVYNRTLDLASLDSVRQFAARFLAEEQRLDILVNNAGIMATPRKLTADGYEQQLGVNHLGHFLLTNLLLERLKACAPSRIVVVSSAMYIFGRIKRNDLNSERSYSSFFGAYSQSKLANVLFTRKLAELLEGTGVTVNCCHPGVVRTELVRHIKFPGFGLLHYLVKFLWKSPEEGAQTQLRLALDPALENSTGGYYSDSMRFPLLPWAKCSATADWLWEESEKLVGLKVGGKSNEMESVTVAVAVNGVQP